MRLPQALKKESPLLFLGGTGGKTGAFREFSRALVALLKLSFPPRSLQTSVQALLRCVSALSSPGAAEQKGALAVFSSTCFPTVSDAGGRVSREGIGQPARLAHFFVLHHLQVLPFTPVVRSGVEEQLIIIFKF